MTSFSLQSLDDRHVRRLRRVRWLAAGIVCGVGVAIELVEDPTFDLDLFIELFVYILIIPALTWLAFTLVARLLAQRLKIDRSLNRYRQFIRELTHYQEWNEVVQYLVKLPGTLQSVKSAALLVYDHRHAQLRLASSWRSDHLTTYLPDRAPPLATCRACLSRHSSGVRASAVCLAVQNGLIDAHPDEYCLSLAHEGVLVGILKFRFRAGDKPNAETLDFLNAVAPDIALALALSAAHPAEVAQVRITAKVEERQQMAYELHDALAQQIAFLQLTLDHLARNHPSISPAELRKDLELASDTAKDAYDQIRDQIEFLRTSSYTDLTQALFDYVQVVTRTRHVSIQFETCGQPTVLSASLSVPIFHLVQEGLTNILKHAQTNSAVLKLSWSANYLEINLTDDGIGFDPVALSAQGHYGLTMMRERVAALHGWFNIETAPGKGTRLTLRFSLSSRPASSTILGIPPELWRDPFPPGYRPASSN